MVRKIKDTWVCSVTRVLLRSALPLVAGMGQVGLSGASANHLQGCHRPWGSGVVPGEDRNQDREIQSLRSGSPSLKMETHTLP